MSVTVASFYAPRPDHPYFQDYGPYLDLLRASCARHGHRHIVLTDDPEVGEDAYVTPLPRSLMRAVTAAQYAWLSHPANAATPTLLTGADCVLAQDPEALIRALPGRSADIYITVGDFADCRMNTGFIFIPRPASVAHVWADALKRLGDGADDRAEWGDDQRALLAAIEAARDEWPADVRVRELPVEPWNLAPVHPGDDCRRGVVLHFRGPRKAWMEDYCHKWLDLGDGVPLKMTANTDDAVGIAQIGANLRALHPTLHLHEPNRDIAVLVGSGPSAADDFDLIALMARTGATVFGLNGAARWLVERGVTPDYGVLLDMREGNRRFVEGIEPTQGWLLASHCHPAVVAAAARVTLYHHGAEAYHEHLPPGATLIGGGPTVGISAMYLACVLGFRRLHLFGYDSSFRAAQTHLLPQPMNDAESVLVEAHVGPRSFVTNAAMYGQAAAFEQVCGVLHGGIPDLEIAVHGDGLLPALAHAMIATSEPAAAQAA